MIDNDLLPWATPTQEKYLRAVDKYGGYRKAARALKVSQSAISRSLKDLRKKAANQGCTAPEAAGVTEVAAPIGKITEPIRTIKELLTYADVDQDVWDVTKKVVNCWGDNYQVKAWLSPKAEVPILKAIKELNAWQPKDFKFGTATGDVMAIVAIFDHHFGKLAWREETNSDYDLKIAESSFMAAGKQLLAKVEGFNIEKIVFPLGGDFLHIDNTQNTTTGGTQQDVDSRLHKILAVAKKCVIQFIMECLKIAPVEVIYVPGNHDFTVSYYLTDTIGSWFRETEQVTVCQRPLSRKYIDYGVNMIGLSHGDLVKPDRLALLIMDENKTNLADKEYLEWLTGHYHKKAEKMFHAGESFGSVVVKTLPSLCGTDAWHYNHGFVNSRRAAEIHLYNKETGPDGYFPVHIGNLK